MTTFREYREATATGMTPDRQVRNVPIDAVPFQGKRAGFVSRALAAGIDVLLVFLVVLGTIAVIWALSFIFSTNAPASSGKLAPDRIPGPAAMVLYGYWLNWAYWTIGWATSGRTVGNLVMGLRVINREGRHPRWIGAAVRAAFSSSVRWLARRGRYLTYSARVPDASSKSSTRTADSGSGRSSSS